MVKSVVIKVKGRVQGVYYRATAFKKAEELGLNGFVKNEKDGTVYAEAEGDNKSIDEFVEWCKKGPRASRVDNVEVKERDPKGFVGFKIEY